MSVAELPAYTLARMPLTRAHTTMNAHSVDACNRMPLGVEGTQVAIQLSSPSVRVQRDCVDLLGIPVDRIALETVVDWIESAIASREPRQIITANLDFIAIKRKRPSFEHVIQHADLVVCDGKPLQWAARLRGHAIPSRVTGMDLMLHAARLSQSKGYRIFLMGAAPGVAPMAVHELRAMFPGASFVGSYTPPNGTFSDEDNERMVEAIRVARPDVLFVALGAPKQDEWIAEHLQLLGVPVCVGVGGVFDMFAGLTRRAPAWIQNVGMEWAFRMAQEPSRLWRRYLVNDLPVLVQLLGEQLVRRVNAVTNAFVYGPPAISTPDFVPVASQSFADDDASDD